MIATVSLSAKERLRGITWSGVTSHEIDLMDSLLVHHSPGRLSRLFHRYPEFTLYLFEQDKAAIRRFIQDQGYLKASLKDSLISQAGLVDIIYQIDKGELYRVTDLQLTGINDQDSLSISGLIKSQPGLPYSPQKTERDSSNLLIHYQNHGYLDTRIKVTRRIRDDTREVSLGFTVKPSSRYRINRIRYQGQNKVAVWQIRRELTIRPGEYFDYDKIRESRNYLYQSGHFSYVGIVPEKNGDSTQLILAVKVTELKPRTISLFTNYLQEEHSSNLAFNLEYTFTNLFNNGQILTFNPSYSFNIKDPSRDQKLGLSLILIERWFMAYRLPVTFSPSYYFIRNDISRYEVWGSQVQFRHSLTEKAYVVNSFSIRKKLIRGAASEEIENQLGSGWHNGVESILENDSRDDFFSPQAGAYYNIHQTVISRFFGGNNNYYKLKLTGCRYTQRSSYRLQFGFGASLRRGEAYPLEPEERFLLGGANTIRGYGDQKIGLLDPGTGKRIGGRIFWLFNLNRYLWDWKLFRQIAFLDIGNNYSDWQDFEPWRTQAGVGTGLHLLTPIGPLRLEMGYPIGKPLRWNTLVFHLALLPMF